MKYATIDAQGNPTGFYDDEIHQTIPQGAVPIPDADWQAHINGQRKVYDSTNKAWIDYVPSAAELLKEAKAAKLSELKAAYDAAISADIAYMNTAFQADPASQDMITKVLAASGGTLPAGFFWLDAGNNQVPMTYADLQGLANAILLRGQQEFAHYQSLKAQVKAAADVPTVQAIVW